LVFVVDTSFPQALEIARGRFPALGHLPPGIRSVINKIKRSGIPVTPYVFPPSQANVAWRSQKMVVVNGVLCTIQLRKGSKKGPNRGEYARFDVNREVKRAKVALWAMRSGRRIRVYVIPLTICEKSLLFIFQLTVNMPWTPARNPRKDWTRYERAWHLLA
jgi:hypothetical protein